MSTRELIDMVYNNRYARRDNGGRFKASLNVGASLSTDRRKIKRDGKSGEHDGSGRHAKGL
jgi:hypothetical protein